MEVNEVVWLGLYLNGAYMPLNDAAEVQPVDPNVFILFLFYLINTHRSKR